MDSSPLRSHGCRHGFDWDHIAALTDLTGSQSSGRRSTLLATLYSLGHAAMVIALGLVAIVFAERLPESVDAVMERVVGLMLIALAAYIAWALCATAASSSSAADGWWYSPVYSDSSHSCTTGRSGKW